MIKVIAFDLIGVLIKENDYLLTEKQKTLKKLLTSNTSDENFFLEARGLIPEEVVLMNNINYILSNIYDVNDSKILKTIREKHEHIKLVIATNHISLIREFIKKNFDMECIDKIFISAEVGKMKPYDDFYKHIIKDMDIEPDEMLLMDDSEENIETAKSLGINAIKVEKDTNIFEEVEGYLSK